MESEEIFQRLRNPTEAFGDSSQEEPTMGLQSGFGVSPWLLRLSHEDTPGVWRLYLGQDLFMEEVESDDLNDGP